VTLDQIQVFHAIVTTGSFKLASEKLHRAQSAVSYAISKLESEIGFSLFTRKGWKAVLTDKGTRFHSQALNLLNQSRELREYGEQLKLSHTPELIIGRCLLCCDQELIKQVHTVRSRLEDISLKIYSRHEAGLTEDLRHKKCHIILTDQSLNDPDLISVRCYDFTMIPVIKKGLSPSVLPQIVSDPPPEGGLSRTRRKPASNLMISVDSDETKKQLICAGIGWGYLVNGEGEQNFRDTLRRVPGEPLYPKTVYAIALGSSVSAILLLQQAMKILSHVE